MFKLVLKNFIEFDYDRGVNIANAAASYLQTEMGSKNHEVVPTSLISQLSGLRGGSAVHKAIATLAKMNLIARVKNAKCTMLSAFF